MLQALLPQLPSLPQAGAVSRAVLALIPPPPQVCLFSEALAEGAVKMGMPSGLAHRIAAQTLLVSDCGPRGASERG